MTDYNDVCWTPECGNPVEGEMTLCPACKQAEAFGMWDALRSYHRRPEPPDDLTLARNRDIECLFMRADLAKKEERGE